MSNQLEPINNGRRIATTRSPGRRAINQQSAEEGFTPRFLISVLERWWKYLLPATIVLSAITTAGVLYTFVPQYRAISWLQINEPGSIIETPKVNSVTDRKFVQTQIELLKAAPILNAAAANPEVAKIINEADTSDRIGYLKKSLKVKIIGDSQLLEVSYSGPNPKHTKVVVDAIIDSYFDHRGKNRRESFQTVIDLLEQEETRQQADVDKKKNEVDTLISRLSPSDPRASAPGGGGVVIQTDDPLQQAQQRHANALADRMMIEAQIKALQSSEEEISVTEDQVKQALSNEAIISETEQLLSHKESMLGRVESMSPQRKESKTYKRMEKEIESLRNSLERLREEARTRVADDLVVEKKSTRAEKLAALQEELDSRVYLEQFLKADLENLISKKRKGSGTAWELDLAQGELAYARNVLNRIRDRRATLEREIRAPKRTQLVNKGGADVPVNPEETIPLTSLAIGILGSMFIPAGIAVLWERSVRRITSPEQLQARSEMDVVGEISRLPIRRGIAVSNAQKGNNRDLGYFEESIDSLRTGLVLAEENQDIQTIAVCSATSGEGKTSVSSQLAVSIARATGKPTLLIDGDMRSPDIHRIFQIPLQPGLSEVLDGDTKLEDAINRSWSDHIHLLPAGELKKNPHKLLGTDEFKAMLEEARMWYRYIVIDTPPVLAASEALVMAREADGTLLCAMRDVSRESHVRLASERLVSAGTRPIGTVLNGVPVRQYAYRYGSYGYERTH